MFSVVAQTYTTYSHEFHVILGNSALLKCDIPSFVTDFVSVVSWVDNDGIEYFPSNSGTTKYKIIGTLKHIWKLFFSHHINSFSVVAQTYNTDARKIHVIIGNSALMKCDIPSFVADFVSVISWVDNDGIEYFQSNLGIFSKA